MLEPTQGRVIAKLGDFGGIDRNGAPIGFLWSNSLVFHGDDVLVTNLSLDVETAISQLADELGLAHLVARNLRTIDGPWAQPGEGPHDLEDQEADTRRSGPPRENEMTTVPSAGLQIRSLVKTNGEFELSLAEFEVPMLRLRVGGACSPRQGAGHRSRESSANRRHSISFPSWVAEVSPAPSPLRNRRRSRNRAVRCSAPDSSGSGDRQRGTPARAGSSR